MAHVTVVKHKRPDDFRKELIHWVKTQDIQGDWNLKDGEMKELLKLLNKFALQIDSINEIHESTYYITDEGNLPDVAIAIIRDYISIESQYIIVNDIELFEDDNILVVITE
jgi:hypothetical protein